MSTSIVTPQAAESVPAASNQPDPSVINAPDPFLPAHGNWASMIRETGPEPQPQPAALEAQPEAPPAEAPAADAPPVEDAAPVAPEIKTEELPEADVQLYEKLAGDIAKQHPGVDQTILKRLTDAQFQVLKLREKTGDQAKDITSLLKKVKQAYKPVMTSLEQSLLTPQAQPQAVVEPQRQTEPVVAPPVQPTQPATPQTGDPIADLISTWRTQHDAMAAESAAWTALHEATTPAEQLAASENINNVRTALLRIQMAPLLNQMQNMVRQEFQQQVGSQLGDILPVVRHAAAERSAQEDMEVALRELEGAGATGARDLFKEEAGEVEYNGAQYPNSPFNRIVAENPEILDIRVQHKDPRVANRLTLIRRMKMALRLAADKQPETAHTQQDIPAETAKALMEAGAAQASRAAADKTRQQMNAGPGSSGSAPAPANDFFGWSGAGTIRREDFYKS